MKSIRQLKLFILLFFTAQLVYGQTSLPINFDSVGFTYVLSDFGGLASSVVTDPTNSSNKVVKSDKPTGSQPWAGVTIGGSSNPTVIGFSNPIPFASNANKISVRVYSPDSGIVVKLKAEHTSNTGIFSEVDVRTKKSNAWDTLVFDFATGTPTLNYANSYQKLSIFFNFGVDGNTAGNKTYYFDDVKMLPPSAPVPSNITFRVDMRKYIGSISGVSLAGSFNGWNAGSNPMVKGTSDTNVWSVTLPINNGAIEYKFVVNGNNWETLAAGTTCTITTGGFTNRAYNVNGNATLLSVCWQSCDECLKQINLPVNFDSSDVNYTMIDFGGNVSSVVNDSLNPSNKVAKVIKTAGAASWAGTTIGRDSGFFNAIPFASNRNIIKMRVYAPAAGMVVRLKAEDAANPSRSVETDATTTAANAWQTLDFNFATQAANTTPINYTYTYKKLSAFFNFGVDGATAGQKIFYFDDVTMPPAIPSNVTFRVDVRRYVGAITSVSVAGSFNGWNATSNPMVKGTSDTNIWSVTLPINNGAMEYKFVVNGSNWETLASGSSCTITTGGFTNRLLNVVANTSLPAVCWQSCDECLKKISLPVNFDSSDVNYTMTDFGGTVSSVVNDSLNPSNKVAKVIKTAGAASWAGTTIGQDSGFYNAIPFASNRNIMKMRVYAPATGMVIRLKAEDKNDPTKSVETDATTTVANAWQTLDFNFATQATGTAAIDYSRNYHKLSAFFNFGVDGATAGQKVFYFDDITMPPALPSNVTFSVNMRKYGAVTDTVYLNGSFNGWCGKCNPMVRSTTDTNIWSVTLPINNGPIEYKFTIKGWTVDEKLAQGSPCTITTGGFTNRAYTVTGNASIPVVCWESCSNCIIVNPNALNMPVTFESTTLNYGLTDFEGNTSSIVADPANASNKVCKAIKSNTAQPWAGTTIGGTTGFDSQIPFEAGVATKISMRVYSPDAGIKVRMKVEDPNDAGKSVETEATTTKQNAWEVLTFDFTNEAAGTAKINYSFIYKKLTVFFNFGVNGATAGEKTYYFDDITFGTITNPVVPKVNVKFTVDTKNIPLLASDTVTLNGTFNGWCGACTPMTKITGTSFWTTTIALDTNTEYEFKYVVGAWKSDEKLASGLPCTKTIGNFTNRVYRTSKANDSIPMVCWESCSACSSTGGPTKTYLTFNVDMSKNKPKATDTVTLNGTFNGWCGACTPMTKKAGSDIWSATVLLDKDSTYDYKYSIGAWTSEETLKEGLPCTSTKFGFTNRTIKVTKTNDTLPVVCWESCNDCASTLPKAKVTFRVNMKDYDDDSLSIKRVTLNGTFNGWCGDCNKMDSIGNNIYSTTLTLDTGTYEFLYSVGNWLDQEIFSPGDPCTKTTDKFTNRIIQIKDTSAVTVGAYCWGTCKICNSTGVKETSLNGVSIYPNPANDNLTVDLGKSTGESANVLIYNMLGELMSVKVNNSSNQNGIINIDTHALKQGIYLLKLETGNAIKTVKFQKN